MAEGDVRYVAQNTSGLGEYIHYHARNYKSYGIGRNRADKPGMIDPQQAIPMSREAIAQGANNTTAAKIEDYLNWLFGNSEDIDLNVSVDQQDFNSILINTLSNKLNQYLVTDNLQVYGDGLRFVVPFELSQKDASYRYKSTVERAVAALSTTLALNPIAGKNIGSGLAQRVQQAQAILSSLKAVLANAQADAASRTHIPTSALIVPDGATNGLKPGSNLLTEAVKILRALKVSVATEQVGEVAEIAFAAAIQCANATTQAALNQIIGQLAFSNGKGGVLTGKTVNNSIIKMSSYYTGDFLKQINTSKMQRQTVGMSVSSNNMVAVASGDVTSKGGYITVDAMLDNVNLGDEVIGRINASIKNYCSSAQDIFGLKIAKDVPLSVILSLLDSGFANHYLNMVAKHPDPEFNEGDVSGAQDAVKYAAAYRALSGYAGENTGNPLANYLIIHDNSTNKWRVESISDLLGLMEDLSSINQYVTVKNIPGSESVPNVFVEGDGGQYVRVANYLAAIHAIKLSVSLQINNVPNKI